MPAPRRPLSNSGRTARDRGRECPASCRGNGTHLLRSSRCRTGYRAHGTSKVARFPIAVIHMHTALYLVRGRSATAASGNGSCRIFPTSSPWWPGTRPGVASPRILLTRTPSPTTRIAWRGSSRRSASETACARALLRRRARTGALSPPSDGPGQPDRRRRVCGMAGSLSADEVSRRVRFAERAAELLGDGGFEPMSIPGIFSDLIPAETARELAKIMSDSRPVAARAMAYVRHPVRR
jgi:hypothetical protein